jgi:signal transduction histidine kinase/ActR/RegA family two-component response regulator
MIEVVPGRLACLWFAGLAVLLALVVLLLGPVDPGHTHLAGLQRARDGVVARTSTQLRADAALGHFIAASTTPFGPTQALAPLLADLVRESPSIWGVVVADPSGRILLESHRAGAASLPLTERALTEIAITGPGPRRALVRTSEVAHTPALVGVGSGAIGQGAADQGRVTVFTLGSEMPSAGPFVGRTWLVGRDGAVMAEPGGGDDPESADAISRAWGSLGRVAGESGEANVAMRDGVHLLLFRPLDNWPATVLIDAGVAPHVWATPNQALAVGLGLISALLVWLGSRGIFSATSDMSVPDRAAGAAGFVPGSPPDREAMARRLAAGVAHDINNALTVLSFDAEMVTAAHPGDAGLEMLSRSMLGATARGAELTQSLLAYAERAVLRPRPVDLADELARRHASFASRLNPGQMLVCVTPDKAGPAPLVMLDPDALEICLGALLRNAAEAAGPRAEIRLELQLTPAGTLAMLVVDDAGPGMDAFSLAHACEPGFSGKRDGHHLGLGLSAAAGFARQSGGRLSLDSPPGLGTRASLIFPVLIPGRRGSQHATPARSGASLAGRSSRVLLVDDSAPVRDSIARRLRAIGYEVIEAQNAGDAEALVMRGVDVMVTDIMLNDAIDGWALAARARERDSTLPLVFMSGFMSFRQPELLAGADLASFVRKPVNGAELHTVIAGLLAMRETRRLAAQHLV